MPKIKTTPRVRKGVTFPIQVSAVCWIDLLGYGAMLAKAQFNPLQPEAKEAVERLANFHRIVSGNSGRNFPSLVMNDGAALFRDLSMRSSSVTYDFLVRSWKLFTQINAFENEVGLPGARAVLAVGFRMTGPQPPKNHKTGITGSILNRLKKGIINAEQAVREAAEVRPNFGIVRELQANFAFTKAYLAESSGRSGGFADANFFVDLNIFKDKIPEWITSSEVVEWSNARLNLQGQFARIDGLKEIVKSGSTYAPGILSGLEVAERIGGLTDVLTGLRSSG